MDYIWEKKLWSLDAISLTYCTKQFQKSVKSGFLSEMFFFSGKKLKKMSKIMKNFFFNFCLFFELVFRECFWEHFKPFFRSKRPLKVFWAPIWGVLEILSQRYLPILLYQKVITSCISHDRIVHNQVKRGRPSFKLA